MLAAGDSLEPSDNFPEITLDSLGPATLAAAKRQAVAEQSARWPAPQARSMARSSLLLRTQERPRKTTNSTTPSPEDISFIAFSENWPNA